MARIVGTDGNDELIGTEEDDEILGLGGDDTLEATGGHDLLEGGAGMDAFITRDDVEEVTISYAGSAAAVNIERDNDDQITASGGDAEGDDFSGLGQYVDVNLVGSAHDDVILTGKVVEGGPGADRLDALKVSYAGSSSDVTVDLAAGTGQGGDAEGDVLIGVRDVIGSAHDDHIIGTQYYNYLYGGAGDDLLEGGGGPDRLYGEAGNDTLEAGDGRDSLYGGPGADQLDGGADWDTLHYNHEATAGVTVDIAGGGEGGDAEGDTYAGIEEVWGTDFEDVLIADDSGIRFRGLEGDDLLIGGAGDDILDGGWFGTNIIRGGEGDDRLNGGDAGPTDLHNDQTFGEEGDDWFEGSYGADLVDGGPGIDEIGYGGLEMVDGVEVDLVAGTANVIGAETSTLRDIENITGTHRDDTMAGDDVRNHFVGLGGNDELYGAGGHDSLWGWNGNDRLEGGGGNDWLRGDSGDDVFVFDVEASSRDRIVDFASGEDKIELSADLQDYAGIHDFEDFQANATETDEGLLVDFSGGRPWTFGALLDGASADDITADDVVFA